MSATQTHGVTVNARNLLLHDVRYATAKGDDQKVGAVRVIFRLLGVPRTFLAVKTFGVAGLSSVKLFTTNDVNGDDVMDWWSTKHHFRNADGVAYHVDEALRILKTSGLAFYQLAQTFHV